MSERVGPGDKAPAFKLPTGDGGEVALKDYKGEALALYFYPKDDTPGCTKQAIAFSERLDAFGEAGMKILGVSRDTPAKHAKFIDKHDLAIDLAADEDGGVCEAYGVWVEKKMYGKTFMGIERSTFLIDSKGVIRSAWRKVKVAGHVEAVLEAAKSL